MSLKLTFCWQDLNRINTPAPREIRNCGPVKGKIHFSVPLTVSATTNIFKLPFVR